jgi:hypothetical protein
MRRHVAAGHGGKIEADALFWHSQDKCAVSIFKGLA